MMLEHLGEFEASRELVGAFEEVLRNGVKTRDLGGTSSTLEFTDAVVRLLASRPSASAEREEQELFT